MEGLPVHLDRQVRVEARLDEVVVGRPQRILKHRVRFELALGRGEFIVIDDDLAGLLHGAHHGNLLTAHEEANVTEAHVEKTTELVRVACIASAVIKLKFALAVLFDSKLSRPHNIISVQVFPGKESHLSVLLLFILGAMASR